MHITLPLLTKSEIICYKCEQSVKQAISIVENDDSLSSELYGYYHRYYCKDCFRKEFVI